VITWLIQEETLLRIWVESPEFSKDLLNLYTLKMPSKELVHNVLTNKTKVVFHESLPETHEMKHIYNEGLKLLGDCIDVH
jgi:hypothetical protein